MSCSQKRLSENLNGDAANGEDEVKNEKDDVEEVKHCCVPVMFKHLRAVICKYLGYNTAYTFTFFKICFSLGRKNVLKWNPMKSKSLSPLTLLMVMELTPENLLILFFMQCCTREIGA